MKTETRREELDDLCCEVCNKEIQTDMRLAVKIVTHDEDGGDQDCECHLTTEGWLTATGDSMIELCPDCREGIRVLRAGWTRNS